METKDVFETVRKYICQSVWLENKNNYDLLAAYAMSTHVRYLSNRIINLQILGDRGTGKTEIIKIMKSLVHTPTLINDGYSPSAANQKLYRRAPKTTILLDVAQIDEYLPIFREFIDCPTIFTTMKEMGPDFLIEHGMHSCFMVRLKARAEHLPEKDQTISELGIQDVLNNWQRPPCGIFIAMKDVIDGVLIEARMAEWKA